MPRGGEATQASTEPMHPYVLKAQAKIRGNSGARRAHAPVRVVGVGEVAYMYFFPWEFGTVVQQYLVLWGALYNCMCFFFAFFFCS